jgi:hypothetical protein
MGEWKGQVARWRSAMGPTVFCQRAAISNRVITIGCIGTKFQVGRGLRPATQTYWYTLPAAKSVAAFIDCAVQNATTVN